MNNWFVDDRTQTSYVHVSLSTNGIRRLACEAEAFGFLAFEGYGRLFSLEHNPGNAFLRNMQIILLFNSSVTL